MKARPHVSMHLAEGNETTRAVINNAGSGVNLWIGGICINADNALLFHELAKVAQLAAQLQESVDERKAAPHPFTMSTSITEALRAAGCNPESDSCQMCGKQRRDHGVAP